VKGIVLNRFACSLLYWSSYGSSVNTKLSLLS